MSPSRAILSVVAVALAVVASACAGSGPDKAGGRAEPAAKPAGKPVVLSLVTGDGPFAEEFAAATARLSGGAIRIDIRVGRVLQANYERFTVEDVQKGKAQLGSVAARVWDTMGVTSLRACSPRFSSTASRCNGGCSRARSRRGCSQGSTGEESSVSRSHPAPSAARSG